MVGDILQPTHLLFILVVALLVLGPKRLPEAGRALGKGLRDFRMAMSGEGHEHQAEVASNTSAPAAPAPTVAAPAPVVAAPEPPTAAVGTPAQPAESETPAAQAAEVAEATAEVADAPAEPAEPAQPVG